MHTVVSAAYWIRSGDATAARKSSDCDRRRTNICLNLWGVSDEERLVNAWFEHRYHAPSDDLQQPVDKQAAARFNQLMATLSERIADAAQVPRWNRDTFF